MPPPLSRAPVSGIVFVCPLPPQSLLERTAMRRLHAWRKSVSVCVIIIQPVAPSSAVGSARLLWRFAGDLSIYLFPFSTACGVRSVHRVCQPAYKYMPTHTQIYNDTHMSTISFAFESVPPMTGLIQSCIFASTKIVQCTHTHTHTHTHILDQSLSPGGGWVI